MGAVAPKIFAKFGSCMQLAPYSAAFFSPVHGFTGCGACQRSAPTGGAANGMPLNDATPFAATPATLPPVTSASRICHSASPANHRLAAASNATPVDSLATASPLISPYRTDTHQNRTDKNLDRTDKIQNRTDKDRRSHRQSNGKSHR